MIERSLFKNWFFVVVLVLVAISNWRWAVRELQAEQFRFEIRGALVELANK